MRRNLWLAVLVVAVIALSRVSQSVRNGLPSGRTEPQFAYDHEGRPITATLSGPQFGDDEVMRVATIPWVYQVNLADSHVTQRGLAALSGLPKLKSLDLSRTTLTDQDFLAVTKLATLAELLLNDCSWLKDEHLARLVALKCLERLELSSQLITPAGLAQLSQLPALQELTLGECAAIDDGAIEHLASLLQLKQLTLSNTGLTSRGYAELYQRLPGVKVNVSVESLTDLRDVAQRGKFSVDSSSGRIYSFVQGQNRDGSEKPLLPGHLAAIGRLAGLKTLGVRGEITDAMFHELKTLPELESLQALNSLITDEGLQQLRGFPSLKSLSMFPTQIKGPGLKHLEHTPHLTRLEIVTQQGNEVIQYLAHLQELDEMVIRAPITDEGLEQLPVLPKLRSLWLNGSQVRGPGIACLAKQPSLAALAINGGLVEDTAGVHIASLASLRWVSLRQSGMTEDGKARLRELRPDLKVD